MGRLSNTATTAIRPFRSRFAVMLRKRSTMRRIMEDGVRGMKLSGRVALVVAVLVGLIEVGTGIAQPTVAGAAVNCSNVAPNADLAGCDLSGANLAAANLSGANLSGANLSGASLVGANLANANLSSSNMTSTNLFNATMTGANLSGVTWSNTTCPSGSNSTYVNGSTCVGQL